MKHIKHLFTAFLLFVAVNMFAQGFTVSTDNSTSWYTIYFTNGGKVLTAEEEGDVTTKPVTGAESQMWKITGNANDGYMFTNQLGLVLYVESAKKEQMVKAADSEKGVCRFFVSDVDDNFEIKPSGNKSISMNFWGGRGEVIGLWDYNDPNNRVQFFYDIHSIDDFVFAVVDGVNTLLGYSGNASELSLPNLEEGYVIAPSIFRGNSDITSVVIPECVTSIGYGAFSNCRGLTSIEIPNSVTSIGESAFSYCYGLTSVVIGNSVTSIGNYAFRGCSGLTSVVIGNSVTSIGSSAFDGCTGLKTVINCSSLTITKGGWDNGYVGYYADNVVNASGLITIKGDFVFSVIDGVNTLAGYIGNETAVVLPDSYNGESYVIGVNAFCNKTSITSIEIPNSVWYIGHRAFEGCSGLTSIVIPNSVTSIWDFAFSGCSALKSIEIPNSVTSIESYAFWKCTGLENIVVENGNKVYDSRDNCNAIIETSTNILTVGCKNSVIPNSVTSIGDHAFYNCSGLTRIVIPNSVTSIGNYAFRDCSGLTSIVIPNSVTSIGSYAFEGCTGLENIVVENGNKVYDSRDNCNAIIETSTNILTVGCKNSVIPNSVTSIGDYAFYNCSGLTSIVIPNSVTSIGGNAFYNCSGLTSIEIPNSVTSIGSGAFSGCSALTAVHISDISAWCNIDYTGLGYYANPLYHAKNLYLNGELVTKLVIPDDVTEIKRYTFDGCSGLASVEIHNSVTSIGESAFSRCSGLTSIEIPNSVTSIGNYAFQNCSGLTSIEIPNSVTSIGDEAFYHCSKLTSVISLIPAENLFAINAFGGFFDEAACILYVPGGAKDTYASTTGWRKFTNIAEVESITINEYGSVTYCSKYTLDFSNVERLKAYAAAGYKTNSHVVTLLRVQSAVAGTGLFLKGEPGEYIVPVVEDTDEHYMNMLVGTLEQATVNGISNDGVYANYKYTIKEGEETPLFYLFKDNSTLAAGKAYLQIPLAWLPSTASKSISIKFDEGETTDIDEVEEVIGENGIYDLQGRRLSEITESGIYIIDGKRVFVK